MRGIEVVHIERGPTSTKLLVLMGNRRRQGKAADVVKRDELVYGDSNSQHTERLEGGDLVIFQSHQGWQWHLQQMVIADDPIKYLGDTI